jgi:hypothetical protein
MKELKAEDLKKIYEGNSNEKAAKILKMSVPTLLKCVKMAKIPLKKKPGRKTKFKIFNL